MGKHLLTKWKCQESGCTFETDWPAAISRHKSFHDGSPNDKLAAPWTCSCGYTTQNKGAKTRHLKGHDLKQTVATNTFRAGRGKRSGQEITVAPPESNGHGKAVKPWESSLQFWDLPDYGRKWTPNELRKFLRTELADAIREGVQAELRALLKKLEDAV